MLAVCTEGGQSRQLHFRAYLLILPKQEKYFSLIHFSLRRRNKGPGFSELGV